MSRKEYWDEQYYKYWKSRVEETAATGDASAIVQGDSKTIGDEVYERLFANVRPVPGKLLEIGCAWGRMFPLYKRMGLEIHGVDISSVMIEKAAEQFANDPQVKSLREAEAESLPFPDGFFDNVSCLATFDATQQDQALGEFLRVLRVGGRLYLTGKNSRYFEDDIPAIDAEAGARRKQHPNYFTDVPAMLHRLMAAGQKLAASYFFLRRGDFACNHYLEAMPERFYEWILVIEKGADSLPQGPISGEYSSTFRSVMERAGGGSA